MEKTVGSEPFYKSLPIGAISKFVDEQGDLLQVGDTYFSRTGVPGRLIPGFDASVPASIKNQVDDPELTPAYFATNQQSFSNCAAISDTGVAVTCYGTASSMSIWRKPAGSDNYELIGTDFPHDSSATNTSIMQTDHAGNWIIAKGGYLYLSDDDGLTWAATLFNEAASEFMFDLMWADNGTVLAIFASRDGTSQALYRSTDAGKNWEQVVNSGALATVFYAGADTWYYILEGNATTQTSTDDGLTWGAGPVLPFTPDANGQNIIARASGSTFYILNSTTIYAGNALASVASVGSALYGLGVDGLGNAIAVRSNSEIWRSAAGGAFGATTLPTMVSSVTTGAGDRYLFQFGNSRWVERSGSIITDADLAAGSDGWKDWAVQIRSNSKVADYSPSSGTTIIALNGSSYLRTTDNFATYEIRAFKVAVSNFLSSNNIVTGCATDNNGGWLVTLDNEEYMYISSDDGLTWTETNLGSAVGIVGCAGGNSAGVFLVIEETNASGWMTLNGGGSWTQYTTTGTTIGSVNPVYWDGFFYWVSINAGTHYLQSLDISGSSKSQVNVAAVDSGSSTEPLLQYGSTIALGDWVIRGIDQGAANLTIQAQYTANVYSLVDGQANTLPAFSNTRRFELCPGIYMSWGFGTTGLNNFFSEGISGVTLDNNEFIKVAQL